MLITVSTYVNDRQRSLLNHADDFDFLVAFRPENVFYMTGFWGEGAAVLQRDGTATIIAPELEVGRAKAESSRNGCSVVTAERGILGIVDTLAKRLTDGTTCTDCNDYQTMTHLAQAIPKIKQTQEPFYATRMIKDAEEIRILKKASKIIDCLFELCAQKLVTGQRESELQAVLMSEAAQLDAFDTGYPSTLNPLIVAGGPNGALPHAQVSRRRFKKRDLVVVDITLRHKGYVSDATRTFALGGMDAETKDAYRIVQESQKLGLKAARAGASCSDVDAACRTYIRECKMEDYFIHSTGHGIGLEVHEPPAVSARNDSTILQNGMAITVEPGIYIPGRFGIRIEDSLMVTDGRPVTLHKFTKEMLVV